MPTYSYKAKDRAGNTVSGTVEAIDEHNAAAMVREMGHLPMEIRAARGTRPVQANAEAGSTVVRHLVYPLWTGVNISHLAYFYRQLATLLGAGMALSEALRSVGKRSGGKLSGIIAEMQQNVSNGGRLSDTMNRYPFVFSRLQISLIHAGESGGLFESMVDRIAQYLEYELKVRRMVMKAAAYPIVILCMALSMVICLPHIKVLISDGSGPFMALIWPALRVWSIGAICTIITLKLLFQFASVKLIWDSIKIMPPVVGATARKIAMSRFSRAMAVLYAAGMTPAQAVDVASDASANLYLSRRIKYAIFRIQSGYGLTDSLAETGAITPTVLDMMSVGEKAGSTDAVLQKVADYMDEETDATIHKLSLALMVVMIILAAIVVGWIVIKFFVGVYGGLMRNQA